MSDAKTVVCPHCDSINRIPPGKPLGKGKCGRCHQALFTGKPIAASASKFDRHIQHNDIPVLVDFWAEWCGPCKIMAPVFEKLAGEMEPDIRFLKVDTEAEQGLAARYGIRAIPTVMLFHKGNVVAQQAGAMGEAQLRAWIKQHTEALAPAS